MDDSILKYEEKLWQLFDITKNEMPDLAEAYYGPYTGTRYKSNQVHLFETAPGFFCFFLTFIVK